MPNYPQKMLASVLDTVFPKICLGCGKFTAIGDFDYVCRKCFGKIELKNSLECIGCKRQTRLGFTCTFCDKENEVDPVRGKTPSSAGSSADHAFQAGRTSNGVDQLIIAADLSDILVEKMLKAYKYKFIQSMALPLSILVKRRIKKLLSKKFSLFGDNPLLISVPLHKRRLNERGFNQAELLAKSMADTYHVVYNNNVLIRVANPKHQAEIKKKEERLENVKNNFAVNNREFIRSKTIILVDDICTTGATLNECARVLKESGAKRVIGFVIARGQFARK